MTTIGWNVAPHLFDVTVEISTGRPLALIGVEDQSLQVKHDGDGM